MKTVECLEVTGEEFFALLFDSLLHDIQAAGNHDIKPEDIVPGYTYEKGLMTKLGKQSKATVTIDKLQPPTTYEVSFKSYSGTNTIAYHIEKISDTHINVSVDEKFKGHGSFADANYLIMKFFFQKANKKKRANMLRMMETHIHDERTP